MKNTEEISNWQALIAESLQNLPPNINALDVSEKISFLIYFTGPTKSKSHPNQ